MWFIWVGLSRASCFTAVSATENECFITGHLESISSEEKKSSLNLKRGDIGQEHFKYLFKHKPSHLCALLFQQAIEQRILDAHAEKQLS
jgi:hypothetical protein